jgi:hypothetical protein
MVCIRGGGLRKHDDSPLRSQDAVAAQQLAADMIISDHHGGPTIEVLHATSTLHNATVQCALNTSYWCCSTAPQHC